MKSLVFLSFFLPAIVFAASPFRNLNQIQSQLGFSKYYSLANPGRPLKVAILDKGFNGYEAEIGRTLPANTRYVAGPLSDDAGPKVDHGLKMAQILTALMTNDRTALQWEPQLTLYNVFGFSNFKAAIDDIIANHVDLVLYSEVWEYGGNNDGQGFINTQVSRATQAGVLWINAAGNFALTTFNSGISTGADNWVQLPDQNHALAIRCENNSQGKCLARIVLAWNDFKNDITPGTSKDLDLVLTDDLLNIIQVGGLKQSADPNEARAGYSKYPREIVEAELKPGLYFLRAKNQSKNFTAQDRLRLVVEGDNLSMPSHSNGESLLNPADNPTVITVGASDSDRSSVSASQGKPDIFAPSSIILVNGDQYRGTSNSAAIVAAGAGLLKSREPSLGKEQMLARIRVMAPTTPVDWSQRGLTLQLLGFAPTGPGCFLQGSFSPLPAYVQQILDRGGVLVQTSAALRIMTPYDPLLLAPHLYRNLLNDMIVATPRGIEIYRRGLNIPADAVEIFQRPQEAGLCTVAGPLAAKSFYLP